MRRILLLAVLFLATPALAQRPLAGADVEICVSSTGNDTAAGTCAAPVRHLQVAWDRLAALDLGGHNAKITVLDALGDSPLDGYGPIIGARSVSIIGNETTPIALNTAGLALSFDNVKRLRVAGLAITAGGDAIAATDTRLTLGRMDYGTIGGDAVKLDRSRLNCDGQQKLTGNVGFSVHHAIVFSDVSCGAAVTNVGTPTIGTVEGNYVSLANSYADYTATTFSGAVTGRQYVAHYNSVLRLSGVVTIPGSLAGTYEGGNLDDSARFTTLSLAQSLYFNTDSISGNGVQINFDANKQLRMTPAPSRNIIISGFISVP